MGDIFYLNPDTIKSQCTEGADKCMKKSYEMGTVISKLNAIQGNDTIKCQGFDCIKNNAEDMSTYLTVVNMSLAEYQNSFYKLGNLVGDEVLDSAALALYETQLCSVETNALTMKNICINQARTTKKLPLEQNNMQTLANINISNAQTGQSVLDKASAARNIINEKRKKYYDIENKTNNVFDKGNEYKDLANKIIKSINSCFVNGNYVQNINASWRKEINKYVSDFDRTISERSIGYLKSKGVSDSRIEKLKSFGFDIVGLFNELSSEEYEKGSKDSYNCMLNIMKGNYNEAFKGNPEKLKEGCKRFYADFSQCVFNDYLLNDTDDSKKKEVMALYNGILNDDKNYSKDAIVFDGPKVKVYDSKEKYKYKLGYISILYQDSYIKLRVITEEGADCFVKTGCEYGSPNKFSAEFKKKQKQWKSTLDYFRFNYAVLDRINPIGEVDFKTGKTNVNTCICSINDIEIKNNNDYLPDDTITIKITELPRDPIHATKKIKCDYYVSKKAEKDKEKENKILLSDESEEAKKARTKAMMDISLDTLKCMSVEIDPIFGLVTNLTIDGMTNNLSKAKDVGYAKKAYDIANQKWSISNKVEDATNVVKQYLQSKMPNCSISLNSEVFNKFKQTTYGEKTIKSLKGAGKSFNAENLFKVLDAIEEDSEYEKKMKSKWETTMKNTHTPVVKIQDKNIGFQGIDLSTAIAYKLEYETQIPDLSNALKDKEAVDKVIKNVQNKVKKKKISKDIENLAIKIINDDVDIREYLQGSEKKRLQFFKAYSIVCSSVEGNVETYSTHFENLVNGIYEAIKKDNIVVKGGKG